FIPLATAYRFSFRLAEIFSKFFEDGVPTLIYGAGRTTNFFLPALLKPSSGIRVVGLIDDDPNKRRGEVQGVPVVGNGEDLPTLVSKLEIQQVIICMPTLEGSVLRNLIAKIRDLSVVVKVAPDANSYLNTEEALDKVGLRDLNIEDLLRRKPRKVDQNLLTEMVEAKGVLITGGGGSIGSELCRQILAMNPSILFINDASEFNLYTITEELKETFPDRKIIPILDDLSRPGVCEQMFALHKIHIVFHAAAYKHVPLVEHNIKSAIQNNISGTYNLFNSAWAHKVERVVLVSSDKAVNPTNAMGATKRVCELIGLWFCQNNSGTSFSAVRFGNVLGSSGSVIPKFLKQIKEGGPVSITHPDITRYFMLIPEAVSLVLQAARSSESGDLYVLDMGEPIKILDLARDLLEIMGLKEGVDISFEFTGLRPGEKMFEELYLGDEELDRISIDFYKVVNVNRLKQTFLDKLLTLIWTTYAYTEAENRESLFDLIKSAHAEPDGLVRSSSKKSPFETASTQHGGLS
ncbi:MAG: polysaccharide biosynthesis protein, partial [Proteobacteria bacterium]